MPNLSPKSVLVAVLAALPAAAPAAPVRGLTHQKSVYVDAAEVPLRSPEGVACDEQGALVVADTGNGRLLTFTWKDGALDGGKQIRLAQLSHPVRLQIDSKGFVLALDRRARKIVRIDASGAFAGYLDVKGASAPGVTPSAFKLDAADNAYLLDVVAGSVLVVGTDGRVTRELRVPRNARGITDLAADSSGRIFLVDAPTAVVFGAEPGDKEFRPLSGSLKEMISFPGYLAADGRGRLWVADQNGNAVVRVGIDGTFQGRDLSTGAGEGALRYPGQLCVTAAGDLFVADRNNHRVQVFALPR